MVCRNTGTFLSVVAMLTALIQVILNWSKRAPDYVNTTFFEHHGIKHTYITSKGRNGNAITNISVYLDNTTMLYKYHTACCRAAFRIQSLSAPLPLSGSTDLRQFTTAMMLPSQNSADSKCLCLQTFFVLCNSFDPSSFVPPKSSLQDSD